MYWQYMSALLCYFTVRIAFFVAVRAACAVLLIGCAGVLTVRCSFARAPLLFVFVPVGAGTGRVVIVISTASSPTATTCLVVLAGCDLAWFLGCVFGWALVGLCLLNMVGSPS